MYLSAQNVKEYSVEKVRWLPDYDEVELCLCNEDKVLKLENVLGLSIVPTGGGGSDIFTIDYTTSYIDHKASPAIIVKEYSGGRKVCFKARFDTNGELTLKPH